MDRKRVCKKSSAKKKMMSIELKREIIEKHEPVYVSYKYKQNRINAFCAYGPDKELAPLPLSSQKKLSSPKLKFANSGGAQLPKQFLVQMTPKTLLSV
ncbi:hypothetical protein TNIN_133751 [Trichonephila inaurata madagascariensis]|uniref:Uncharacterized protein n=1 Tax=Trichonephila inaurata madagascariensis TaxID=2747483 RepID=A0A8X7CL88_9ARAC|nr:hypothetical protein TNIN_133751 [Trichonephila inaurata madagascariensis]